MSTGTLLRYSGEMIQHSLEERLAGCLQEKLMGYSVVRTERCLQEKLGGYSLVRTECSLQESLAPDKLESLLDHHCRKKQLRSCSGAKT